GETAAIQYLKANGYTIRHINWRREHLELDIVAQTAEELVIVEVKTRSRDHWELPEDAVNSAKIKRIVSAADFYIELFDLDLPVRFDIISVTGTSPGFEIEHIEDAFYSPVNTY
ncbi:MAG: YraN family protein, partial [Dysgonamonadaceae bacterium]|nr:YraN family protein [Dysgonamonadaceae bacterium]